MKSRVLAAAYFTGLAFGVTWGGSFLILQLYAYSLGANYLEVALLSALFSLTMGIFQPFWGILSDTIKKRKLFIITNTLLSIPIFLSLTYPYVPWIIVGRMFWAAVVAAVPVILMTVTSEVVSARSKGKGLGGYNAATSFGYALGLLSSGFFFNLFGILMSFVIYSLLVLLSVFFYYFSVPEVKKPAEDTPTSDVEIPKSSSSLFSVVYERIILLKKGGPLTVVSFLVLLLTTAQGSVFGLLSIYLLIKGIPRSLIGLLFSVFSFIALPTSPLFGHLSDIIGRKKVLILSALMYILSSLMYYYLPPDPLFVFLAISINGSAFSALSASSSAYVADVTSDDLRGEAMGVINGMSSFGWGFGPIIAGTITLYFGIESIFLVALTAALFAGILTAAFLKESLKK